MKKVLFIDTAHPCLEAGLVEMGFVCDQPKDFKRQDYLNILCNYEGIIIRSKITLDEEALSKATKLKFIGRLGAGMESIDTHFAEKKGIICLNTPEGNRDAVGEQAIGMLLNLMNHLNRADHQVRSGEWIREGNRGEEIKGKTIAIIGYGNMGGSFAKKLAGFEAKVVAYDKYKSDYSDANVQAVDWDYIHENADVLSLHVPLTDESKYLIDDECIRKFHKPFYLINTSRGPVVETKALVEGLKMGKVKAAGLDVIEYEETSFEKMDVNKFPEAFTYLKNADNVILTPHIAGWTFESLERHARIMLEKIQEII